MATELKTSHFADWPNSATTCDYYEPVEIALDADNGGECDTDGHYLCAEGRSVCKEISQDALRRRRDRCEECSASLVGAGTYREHCPVCEPGGRSVL